MVLAFTITTEEICVPDVTGSSEPSATTAENLVERNEKEIGERLRFRVAYAEKL
jgi:hypothetical protein